MLVLSERYGAMSSENMGEALVKTSLAGTKEAYFGN